MYNYNNNVDMKLVRRRVNDPILGDITSLVGSSPNDVKIITVKNVLSTSITQRVFNVDIVKSLNISLYMLVDRVIENLNLEILAKSGDNIKEILYQLLRNEMIRISLELQSTVSDHQINKIMEILSPDIDTCSVLLKQINK